MKKYYLIIVLTLIFSLSGCKIISTTDSAIEITESAKEGPEESKELEASGESASQITREELYGEYICEEPGFGGLFTLTLQEDGKFTYYEGALSSYIGYGAWDYSENKLTLKDIGYNEEWDIFFTVENGHLIYDKEPSHTFIYTDLADGTRFISKKLVDNEWLEDLTYRTMEQERARVTKMQEMNARVKESREEILSQVYRQSFLGDGFSGYVCFDATQNQKDPSAPIRIWVEDGLGNTIWEESMGLAKEDRNSYYFYEAPGTCDYIIEYNADTKYHFEMFTLNLDGEKVDDVIHDVPETTDRKGFNTEVKKYLRNAKLIIGTIGGSVAIRNEYEEK